MKTEMARHPFIIQATVMDAQVIMGYLILALKHPDNKGPATRLARGIARDIYLKLKEAGFYSQSEIREIEPEMAEVGIEVN
jgi:hypothetical protein